MWMQSFHPIIQSLAKFVFQAQATSDTGFCDMLDFEGKIAVCMIEKYLGREFKPDACKEYPFNGEKCRNEENR